MTGWANQQDEDHALVLDALLEVVCRRDSGFLLGGSRCLAQDRIKKPRLRLTAPHLGSELVGSTCQGEARPWPAWMAHLPREVQGPRRLTSWQTRIQREDQVTRDREGQCWVQGALALVTCITLLASLGFTQPPEEEVVLNHPGPEVEPRTNQWNRFPGAGYRCGKMTSRRNKGTHNDHRTIHFLTNKILVVSSVCKGHKGKCFLYPLQNEHHTADESFSYCEDF
ncbi:Bifunctional Epoxide Hydrolase 2 [Manis pentadactyla]|nr:Bifunctional Epoxide Hydrolase 2 [Manis pentadactyla]